MSHVWYGKAKEKLDQCKLPDPEMSKSKVCGDCRCVHLSYSIGAGSGDTSVHTHTGARKNKNYNVIQLLTIFNVNPI